MADAVCQVYMHCISASYNIGLVVRNRHFDEKVAAFNQEEKTCT